MTLRVFVLFLLLAVGFSVSGQHNALLLKDKRSKRFKIFAENQKIKFWMKDYPKVKMRGRLQQVTDSAIVVDGTAFSLSNINKIAKSQPALTVFKVIGAAGVVCFAFWVGVGVLLLINEYTAAYGLVFILGGTAGGSLSSVPLFIPDKKYKSEQWEFLPYHLPIN